MIGLFLIVLILGSPPVRRLLLRFGHRYARNRLSGSLLCQPVEVVSLGDDHGVYFLPVATEPDEGVRSLRGLQGAFAPVRVLGIRRGDDYLGEPPVDLTIHMNDELVLYGRTDDIAAIAQDSDGATSVT